MTTQLHAAFRYTRDGRLEELQKLIQDVNISLLYSLPLQYDNFPENNYNFLNVACALGRLEVVKYLINKGMLLTGTPRPINVASQFGQVDVLEYLLQQDKNAEINDLFAIGVKNGHINIVRFVVKHATQINHKISIPEDIHSDNPFITQIIDKIRKNEDTDFLVSSSPEDSLLFQRKFEFEQVDAAEQQLIATNIVEHKKLNAVHFACLHTPFLLDRILALGADPFMYSAQGYRFVTTLFYFTRA